MKRSSCWHCFFLTVIVSTIALVLFGFIIFRLAENSYFREEIFASSDNQSAQKIEEITDNPPKIELVGDLTVKISCIDDYKEPGVKVIDDIDGDISSKVQTEMIKKNDYNYQVLYNVTDSNGNKSSKFRNIKIVVGIVCLTFDDGPSREITPQILDILKEKNVNATFFINGYSSDKSDLIKREADEGNVIGLHGYSHDYETIYSNIDNLMNNFYKLGSQVKQTTGKESKFIRFPGGTSNTISKKYCIRYYVRSY